MKHILLVTHSHDNQSVELLRQVLESRGAQVTRLDTDAFPTEHLLTLKFNAAGAQTLLETPLGIRALDDVTAIWYRRIRLGHRLDPLESSIKAAAIAEVQATLLGMLCSLKAYTLNSPIAVRATEHKPLQLRLATELGLNIPQTVITNQPLAVHELFRELDGNMVTKMLSSTSVLKDGKQQAMFTSEVLPEHLGYLSGLKWSPMVFQERIAKKLELRVTIVGKTVFCAAVDPSLLPEEVTDWREASLELLELWQPYTLPESITYKLFKLMQALKIDYGAIDMILTPEDEYVFLELNPAGEYFWLELYAGLPISEALADVLLAH